jgi:PTH1 family peptidyl-tRNA hydrolase
MTTTIYFLEMFRLFSYFGRNKTAAKAEEADTTMKYLIVGLGNKGAEYDHTRHNIGFEVIDYLAGKYDVELENVRYGWVGKFRHKGRTFILLKPNTYMNLSGQAIRYWLQKEKIKQENLLVILDDLNIDFGRVRIKGKGGAGGHNGLKNIEQVLGNASYSRIRMGIGDKFLQGQQVDFVLGKWTNPEADFLPTIVTHAAKAVLSFGTAGLANTMNTFNKTLVNPNKK